MSLEQVKAVVGADLVEIAVPADVAQGLKIYAGEQILVGLVNGKLEYVETVAINAVRGQ